MLQKDDLQGLSPDEQQLVAAPLVIKNEIGILLSCVVMAFPRKNDESDPICKARSSQALFFLLLLAGKLNEAWKLLSEQHIGKPHFEALRRTIDSPARRALGQIEKYFAVGSKPICMMRNNFAFHYRPQVVADSWARLPADAQLELWFRTSDLSSRYDLGAVLASRELARVFTAKRYGQRKPGFKVFLDDVEKVSVWFSKLFGGILLSLLDETIDQRAVTVRVPFAADPGLPAFPGDELLRPVATDESSGESGGADRIPPTRLT